MGNITFHKINFEELQSKLENNDIVLINTLPNDLQNCLIYRTIEANQEVEIINDLIKKNKKKEIIIYGKNSADMLLFNKYKQLLKLGFINISVYTGGLFEWLLLQDIYGNELFKTTSDVLDILKYK